MTKRTFTTGGKWWIGVTAGVALGLGGVVAVDSATQEASAQSATTFRVTPEQLRINQRISQAAVRRSNEGLQLLDPLRKVEKQPNKVLGWRTQDLRDDAVTANKLAPTVREGQPRWAVLTAGTGALARAKGATASAKLAEPGDYSVTFDRDVSACAIQATIADTGTSPVAPAWVTAWRSGADAKVVLVRTTVPDDGATDPDTDPDPVNDRPVHVTVLC